MKVTHWWKKLSAAIVAAGIWVPNAYAVSIPLGDAGFETYVVPASPGYAYAANPVGAYRVSPAPLSAWVDDLDAPAGYTQDDGASNWIYVSTYAEASATNKRPAPRTGNQAMHGLFNYSAQETSAVFEAGATYTFSLWAQNDQLLDNTNGVFLYIFNGSLPFSDANSLASTLHTATIPQRAAGMTAAQSQANWALISVAHTVAAGAPEIGQPVGVGFFARRDSAVDDASLDVVPEPGTILLVGMSGLTVLGLRRRR